MQAVMLELVDTTEQMIEQVVMKIKRSFYSKGF